MRKSGKRSSRRTPDAFNLSFLDVICCGFGAVILLLVLSRFAEPVTIENLRRDLENQIQALTLEINELTGETEVFNRDLTSRQEQLAMEKAKLARLQGQLSKIKGRHKAEKQDAQVKNIIEEQLKLAQQRLTEEMKRLQKDRVPAGDIGGVPVDSEYIIFIIDTSGSMLNYSWKLMLKKVEETLAIYPKVKGIQVMNDMGQYLFSQYRRKWIPDSAARRRAIIKRLRNWQSFSNSSPVEGIIEAIRTFHAPDKKISLYVFGDEFTGPSIDQVIRQVDRINKRDRYGNRRVRIHAVGFPVAIEQKPEFQITGIRFATLMRLLCYRNGGAFVGLDKY